MNLGKSSWAKKCLSEAGLDALLVRLPENVLYLTGYWPCFGWSTCLYPLDGEPILLLPEFEARFAQDCGVKDIYMLHGDDLASATIKALREAAEDRALYLRRVGFEENFEIISANHVGGEVRVPTVNFFKLVEKVLTSGTLIDATQLIHRIRSIKWPSDVQGIKMACKAAFHGLSAALNLIREGVKECDVAAAAEAEVHRVTVGFQGVKRARAYAFVMSGPNAGQAYWPFNISTDRKLKRGDLVLIELNTVVEGYWSDLTRVWTCGSPSKKQKEVYESVYRAFTRVIQAVKEGIGASQLFEISQECLKGQGLANYAYPFLGHGIGVGLHEPIPTLTPQSSDMLKTGMVHTVEPGVYVKGRSGIRLEDVILVKRHGQTNLSQTKYGLDEI